MALAGEDAASLEVWDMRSGTRVLGLVAPDGPPRAPGSAGRKAGMLMAVSAND